MGSLSLRVVLPLAIFCKGQKIKLKSVFPKGVVDFMGSLARITQKTYWFRPNLMWDTHGMSWVHFHLGFVLVGSTLRLPAVAPDNSRLAHCD